MKQSKFPPGWDETRVQTFSPITKLKLKKRQLPKMRQRSRPPLKHLLKSRTSWCPQSENCSRAITQLRQRPTANLIVSGDKNPLLALERVEGIPIVTARKALALISQAR